MLLKKNFIYRRWLNFVLLALCITLLSILQVYATSGGQPQADTEEPAQKGATKKQHNTGTEEKRYKCPHSDTCFVRAEDFFTHECNKLTEHKKKQSLQCDICKKTFKRQRHLDEHYYQHTGKKPFGCDQCDKRFTRLVNLTTHKRIVHEEIKDTFKCDICHKGFARPECLQRHLKRKHEIKKKKFQCNICYKTFAMPGYLQKHMKRHEKVNKEFQCNICYKTFTMPGYLQKHLKRHEKVKENPPDIDKIAVFHTKATESACSNIQTIQSDCTDEPDTTQSSTYDESSQNLYEWITILKDTYPQIISEVNNSSEMKDSTTHKDSHSCFTDVFDNMPEEDVQIEKLASVLYNLDSEITKEKHSYRIKVIISTFEEIQINNVLNYANTDISAHVKEKAKTVRKHFLEIFKDWHLVLAADTTLFPDSIYQHLNTFLQQQILTLSVEPLAQ